MQYDGRPRKSELGVGEPSASQPLKITSDMLAAEPVNKRRDFERGMSYHPPATLLLMIVLAVLFAWELATGTLSSEESLVSAGALTRSVLTEGEVWRLVSMMFLRGGFDHLIGNCLALYVLGMAAEHAYGSAKMLLVYWVAGLSGSLLSVILEGGPTVGASGAIFGLLGFLIITFRRYGDRLRLRDSRIGFVLLLWAGFMVAIGFFDAHTANFAHLGGLAGGAMLGLLLHPSRLLFDPESRD